MRVFSEIDPDTYDRIEEAVREGKYRDVDQFIRVAVQNQLNIEDSGPESEPITDGTGTTGTSAETHTWGYTIPENPPVSSPFEMDRENKLLFQQYYRFFPLTPILAELAKKTSEAGEPVVLSEFRDHMSTTIEPIRDAILDWEEENNVKKKNRKSTGLPKVDVKNPEYSKKRYLDHFVGKIRKRDLEPKSFPHTMGFISYDPIDEERCLIQLTPAGKKLIQMGNPLLNEGPSAPALSLEEQEFIVTHLRETLPTEYELMETIYTIISENGNETYTNKIGELGEYLRGCNDFDEDASEERVRSHVAGALSRMVELGILDRGSKRGVYVPSTPPEELAGNSVTTPA